MTKKTNNTSNISRITKKDKANIKDTIEKKIIKRIVCKELGYDVPHKGVTRNHDPVTRSKELREIKKCEKRILEDPEEMLSVLFESCAKVR